MLLGLRKRAEPIEHRRAELMQPANSNSISHSTPAIWATRKPEACGAQ
jgi:hypothetical protein